MPRTCSGCRVAAAPPASACSTSRTRCAAPPPARTAATEAYLAATGADRERLGAEIAAASAQRGLRILGRTFARLALQQDRTSYLRFIPPAWTALQRDLRHPALSDLRRTLDGLLPEPDAAFLADLAARAGTCRGRDHAGPP